MLFNFQKKLVRQVSKPRSQAEEKVHFEEELKLDQVFKKEVKKENNLYLQVLSCLSKVEKNEKDKDAMALRLKQALNEEKIEINDKKLIKIVGTDPPSEDPNDQGKVSDELKKIIDAEMSEEEYVTKTKMRFKRPPHCPEELKKVLEQSDKIYEENKPFLFVNDQKVLKNYKEVFMKKIPRFFTMRKLVYPPTKTEILLCGVRRNSNIHSAFLAKVLDKLSPDAIMLHMPPDLPLFIETEGDYRNGKSMIKKSLEVICGERR